MPASSSAAVASASSQPLYWWPAQAASSGRAMTVIFDSSCSTGAPRALVAENSSSITIELLGPQSTQCAASPSFGLLRIPLVHQLDGRAIVGSRADPRLPNGSPTRNVAGRTAPRVVGFSAMDAKLALRMAGLVPHAASSSLTAVVIRERQAGARSRKVLLTTGPRPRLRMPRGGQSSSLGAATPAPQPTAAAPAGSGPPSVPATCPNANLTPNSSNLPQVEVAAICLVNQQRVQAGLVPLSQEPHLQQTAEQHSLDEVVNNYFSHTTPSGQTFGDRILASGYVPSGSGCQLGENLAWGTTDMSTPASMVAAWMNSAEHRANILNPNFRDTGMGIEPAVPASTSQSPGATYTQDFGVVD